MKHDKNVYIKKIETIGRYAVWLVDGAYVRKAINENFVEYDHHLRFRFIPQYELWIDEETNPEERRFFINHMFVEQGLMKEGESYEEALKTADLFEKKERGAELEKNRLSWLKKNRKELMEKVYKKFLSHFSRGKIEVWLVDGKIVRDFFSWNTLKAGMIKFILLFPRVKFG